MTADDPGARLPTNDRGAPVAPSAPSIRTIELIPSSMPSHAPVASGSELRFGGGVSLTVSLLGLSGRYAVSPEGWLGGALTLVAAALTVLGLLLLLGGLGYYVLAPAFAGPGVAWRGVGSHRLVIATTVLIILLANAGPVAYVAIAGADAL